MTRKSSISADQWLRFELMCQRLCAHVDDAQQRGEEIDPTLLVARVGANGLRHAGLVRIFDVDAAAEDLRTLLWNFADIDGVGVVGLVSTVMAADGTRSVVMHIADTTHQIRARCAIDPANGLLERASLQRTSVELREMRRHVS